MRAGRLVALIAVAGLLVGALGGVAAADPDAGCIGTERGTPFETDGGFTVWYNDSEPMPRSTPFVDDQTLRFRNVTLSSGGATELVLEDGTGPETCLGGIDAGAAPITIDPDGEQAVRVGGQVRALSIADAQYGDGAPDLAYDATSEWSIVVTDTGLGQDTTVEAVDASGNTLDTGTVDGSDSVRLTLPSGTYEVALREQTGSGSDGGTDSGGDGSGGGSDGSGDGTSDTGGSTTDDGGDGGSTSGSDGGSTSGSDGSGSGGSGGDSGGSDSDSGPPLLLIGGGILLVLVAGGVGYVLNGDGTGADDGDGSSGPTAGDDGGVAGAATKEPAARSAAEDAGDGDASEGAEEGAAEQPDDETGEATDEGASESDDAAAESDAETDDSPADDTTDQSDGSGDGKEDGDGASH